MNKTSYITDCQAKRIRRDTEIIIRFKEMKGAIVAITSALSLEFNLSPNRVRVILKKHNCIGHSNSKKV